jgi:hypothetical protein
LARTIEFNFSHVFQGLVWSTVTAGTKPLLLVEARDSEKKKATFSALDLVNGSFLWRDMAFDEPWWVSLSAASDTVAVFSTYLETSNPDKKGVLAYHIFEQKVLWWNNDFSLVTVGQGKVTGVASKYGNRSVTLDLVSGAEVAGQPGIRQNEEEVRRPQQYLDDNAYFSTVKTFLNRKFNLLPVIALEYLEHDSNIFISFYIQEESLANYLFIISAEGELLMKEKLGDHLKGIGLDTFFVIGGSLFFVKDKVELFSYKFV